MENFQYITQQKQLEASLNELTQSICLAIDTESSGYYTYYSELCLIQISSKGKHYIIDPLSGLDLDQLGLLCKEPKITKIFHSASSDIAELKRTYNWDFVNIFDTFIASRFLGHANCSLSGLVSEYEGVELEKKEQKSNWKKRPLTPSQLEYAHLDTVYLESVMNKLKEQIEKYEMYEEVSEEFVRTCQVEVEPLRKVNPDGWKKIPQAKQLSIEKQAMLRALYLLRDERGRKENIAAFRLLPNHILISLVKERPNNLEKPKLSKTFHPVFSQKDAKAILEILNGQHIDPILIEKELYASQKKPNQENKSILKDFKIWRKKIAEYRGIDPAMIISNRHLEIITKNLPEDMKALEKLSVLTNWKKITYGPQILAIIQGKYDGQLPANLIDLNILREKEREK